MYTHTHLRMHILAHTVYQVYMTKMFISSQWFAALQGIWMSPRIVLQARWSRRRKRTSRKPPEKCRRLGYLLWQFHILELLNRAMSS